MNGFQVQFLINKTNVRWLKILKKLEKTRICSATQLSEVAGTTSRTIVNDMKGIRDYFQDEIEISTSSAGYHFKEIHPQEYNDNKRRLVLDEVLFSIIESTFYNELLSVAEWGDKFYLSERTLKRYLERTTSILEKYDLRLSTPLVNLEGSEINIRKFFKDFYYESDITPHVLLPPADIHSMTTNLFFEENLAISSSTTPVDFHYSVYIAHIRSIKGNKVILSKNKIKTSCQDEACQKFVKEYFSLQKIYGYDLDREDLYIIYLTTVCQRSIDTVKDELYFCEKYNIWPFIKEISSKYVETYYQISKNKERDQTLVESFFVSVKLKDTISPILNKNLDDVNQSIVTMYNDEYKKNLDFLTINFKEELVDKMYLLDICASFTAYSESIKEMYWRNPKNIAFILEGNIFIRNSIKSKATRYLARFHQLFFPNVNEFTSEYLKLNKIDIVVTNYSEHITEDMLLIDYVLFESVPTVFDWGRLMNAINPNMTSSLLLPEEGKYRN